LANVSVLSTRELGTRRNLWLRWRLRRRDQPETRSMTRPVWTRWSV